MKNMKNKKSLTRILNDFFCKYWFLSTVISSIPSVITATISILFHQYIDFPAKIILLVCSFISIFFIGLKNFGAKEDIRKAANEDRFHRLIHEQSLHLKSINANYIIKLLENGKYSNLFEQVNNPYQEGELNPHINIKEYCENLTNLLSGTFDTSKNDIGISIIYKKLCDKNDRNEEWELLYSSQLGKDVDFKDMINSRSSTFSAVIDVPNSYYFREKANAEKDRRYVRTEIEKQEGLKGSIFCKNISVVGENKVLPIIFTVTSYDSLICKDSDFNAVEKAVTLFNVIGNNISYELLIDYLYVHMGLKVKM